MPRPKRKTPPPPRARPQLKVSATPLPTMPAALVGYILESFTYNPHTGEILRYDGTNAVSMATKRPTVSVYWRDPIGLPRRLVLSARNMAWCLLTEKWPTYRVNPVNKKAAGDLRASNLRMSTGRGDNHLSTRLSEVKP